MSRRVSLPTADDLFRETRHTRELRDRGATAHEATTGYARPETVETPRTVEPIVQQGTRQISQPVAVVPETAAEPAEQPKAKSSGRVRHDEKMTVYVTADELLEIEHARLSLRRHQGLAVDRGRLVREAIAITLADLEANGDDSVLVQRLIGR